MLRSGNKPVDAKPEFVNLINGLLAEKVNFDRELRSHHRESMVRPVVVKFKDEGLEHECFSRNISVAGVCLISQIEFPKNRNAVLELYQLKAMPVDILSECRWCRPYGSAYWMSGWQFVTIKK